MFLPKKAQPDGYAPKNPLSLPGHIEVYVKHTARQIKGQNHSANTRTANPCNGLVV